MKKRTQQLIPELKPPVKIRLTEAEQDEADRNVAALRAARAAWQLGDIRDAENPCKHCGSDRIEILSDVTKGTHTWIPRCLTCRPMLH